MNTKLLTDIIGATDRYNFHSHSEFCDGRATVSEIAEAACKEGFEVWGVSPHSPIAVESDCNMSRTDMGTYLDKMDRLKDEYAGKMRILTSLETDFLGHDFGPHIDYFQNLPLDYLIGSVHFVPTRDGVYIDCDGNQERFNSRLRDCFGGDIRYVVEKYFEQVLLMLELGGFELLGHFDKIIANASGVDPTIESRHWYESLIDDVISHAQSAGVIVEINTKGLESRGRFFPAECWWPKLKAASIPLAVNSDCHYPAKTNFGRPQALSRLRLLLGLGFAGEG